MKDWEWFDKDADHYEEKVPVADGLGRALVDFAGLAPGLRLLDVGSGTGAVARHALARGCRVTAVDMAPNMVRRLRADLPEITVRRMDVTRLEFPDDSFDVVLAGYVVDILDDPAAALTEIHRVLTPGGTFAASTQGPVRQRWHWLQQLLDEYRPKPEGHDRPTPDVPALLTEAGFAAVEHRLVEHPTPLDSPETLWNRIMSAKSAGKMPWLPDERIADIRERFFTHAQRMHAENSLVMYQDAALYRARTRQGGEHR